MINELLDPEIQQFILDNELADPFELSIKHKTIKGVPFKLVAEQLTCRKVAKSKLPRWYATKGIIYPAKISLEQCSSEITANYKASIIKGSTFIDLTGGMGVDTLAFSKNFKSGVYVEQNAELALLTKHNLNVLGAVSLNVVNDFAEPYLNTLEDSVDLIYIDPARRGKKNEKVFLFSDCEPNIIPLLPALLKKTSLVIIKSSPMLDIDLSLRSLVNVHEVHIISVDNECKEVLYLIKNSPVLDAKVITVNFKSNTTEMLDFYKSSEQQAVVSFSSPEKYLYEPNASIMKAGAFKYVGKYFGLKKLHQHTHLYTSAGLIKNFPGRIFEIEDVVSYNKKIIKGLIPEGKANISTRNFKENVNQFRNKTGLRDGGSKYLFACTDINNRPVVIIAKKINYSEINPSIADKI